jgi:hypothetical protein
MPALIAALVGWRLYARIRRMIGRQRVRLPRLIVTLIVFPLLIVLAGLSSLRDPTLLEGLAGGVVIGIAIGWFALRLTKFEAGPAGLFYTPHAGIGIVLSLLFIGRIVYRLGALYLATGSIDPASMQAFGRSALTLLIFGVLAGYYVTYAAGILRWRRSLVAT